jgi:hypothetical protein
MDNEFQLIKNEYGEILFENDLSVTAGIDDGLRRFISIESNDASFIEKCFFHIYDFYSKVSGDDSEPMMNIISFYELAQPEEACCWRILIFLRKKHRPTHYFREGEDRILLSPAAVDYGGVCILPLEEDFEKVTKENITEIFQEVSAGKEQFEFVKAELKKTLASESFLLNRFIPKL